ncbi:cell division protein FtsL [Jannaschia sp. KMU-145]|uniref:cell division protein FtsL n=1 Tax=Jannaschia halovivens TaxID=3388667 RepID=UPI00396AF9F6
MRGLLYALSIAAVVGLAFWAYREGYDTRDTERQVAQLKREIGARHQELSMLRAEWAYLNRPDRLTALTEMNFERLGLMPLQADHFALAEQIPFPPPATPAFPTVWAADEGLDEKLGEVIIMNHRFGADAAPALIAPPTLADDGEQLP